MWMTSSLAPLTLLCQEFSKSMQDEFEMSMMGELHFFLGRQIKQGKHGLFIHQSKYYTELLKKFNTETDKESSTPMATNCYLDTNEAGSAVDQTKY